MLKSKEREMRVKYHSRAIGIIALAVGLSAVGARAGESVVEKARREAKLYSERSDQYRARLARPWSAEEAQTKKIMDEAAALLGEADTEARISLAVGMYRQATELAPKYDETWSGLGNALFLQGLIIPLEEKGAKPQKLALYGQARAACNKAVGLNSQSPGANVCLANLLLAEGEVKGIWASAMVLPEVFKLSDKVAPKDPYYDDGAIFRTFAVVVYVVPTWIVRRFGFSPEQILPYLDQAVERQPNRFVNYTVRAGILSKLEQKDRALADLQYVLTHDPNMLPGSQQENRKQQKEALGQWKKIAGKEYPGRQ